MAHCFWGTLLDGQRTQFAVKWQTPWQLKARLYSVLIVWQRARQEYNWLEAIPCSLHGKKKKKKKINISHTDLFNGGVGGWCGGSHNIDQCHRLAMRANQVRMLTSVCVATVYNVNGVAREAHMMWSTGQTVDCTCRHLIHSLYTVLACLQCIWWTVELHCPLLLG